MKKIEVHRYVQQTFVCIDKFHHGSHTHFLFHTHSLLIQILSRPSLAANPGPHDVMRGTVPWSYYCLFTLVHSPWLQTPEGGELVQGFTPCMWQTLKVIICVKTSVCNSWWPTGSVFHKTPFTCILDVWITLSHTCTCKPMVYDQYSIICFDSSSHHSPCNILHAYYGELTAPHLHCSACV